jgi:uncharacterized protein (TIGR00299 family) protein
MEHLGIGLLYVSSLPLGSGFAETAHGRIPIPAPATIALMEGIPVYDSGLQNEMVTPTGAALLKSLATSFGKMPPMVLERVGYGVGKNELADRPNLLRMLIGEKDLLQEADTVIVLETNLDDTNPEWLGYLMDRLIDAGALDVVYVPVQMKKNRPGVQVQVLGSPEMQDSLTDILFRETPTLGVRFRYSQRKLLSRSMVDVDSPWGKMRVKKVISRSGAPLILPEYEVCRKIAVEHHRPLREIFYWVLALNKP